MLGGAGAWLGLSYLGVISRDVRATADVVQVGDALGPGAKVRYAGLIVGRVHAVELTDDGPQVTLLVDRDQAAAIPAGATARVLPATAFGSEYVELVAPAAPSGAGLTAGAHLAADTSEETLALMDAFAESQRLLAAIDAEGLSRATGQLAAALDGRGESLGGFLERADRLVTAMNDDTELFYGTLSDATAASDVVTAILPAAADAGEHARTTADTVVQREGDLRTLIDATGRLVAAGDATVAHHSTALIDLLATTSGPLGVVADHPTEVQAILARVPGVLHNGATAIDESSIQMNGLIGLDPLDPYTARDCPRYGPLAGANCGGPVPAVFAPPEPTDPATVATITDLLRALDGGSATSEGAPGSSATPTDPSSPAAPTPPTSPDAATAPTSPLQQLLVTLLGGGR